MSNRFWFYLATVIVVAALVTTHLANLRRLENRLATIEKTRLEASASSLNEYLAQQTDSRKLVALALIYQKTQPELVRPVALRAFELNKNSRDIALLATPYSKEAKERIQFLDPLYDSTAPSTR